MNRTTKAILISLALVGSVIYVGWGTAAQSEGLSVCWPFTARTGMFGLIECNSVNPNEGAIICEPGTAIDGPLGAVACHA